MGKTKKKSGPLPNDRGLDPPPAEIKKILRARADTLSREPEMERPAEDLLEIVDFILAYETYAIETAYIREVYPLKNLIPLPCTPSFILGLINVRGQILSLMDIKKFLNLPEKGLSELDKIIILKSDDLELGIQADRILGVRSIPADKIQPPAAIGAGINEKYLKGVTDERVVILDAGRLLSDSEIIINEEVEI